MDTPGESVSAKIKNTRDLLKNLTLASNSDKTKSKLPPLQNPFLSKSQKKKLKDEVKVDNVPPQGTSPMLERLKQLQKGKITSEQLMKSNPLPKPKKSAVSMDEEIHRNKEEVQRLNQQIQAKISQQIKPKLMNIIGPPSNHLMNGLNGVRQRASSESSQSQREQQVSRPRPIQKPTRVVPIAKTILKTPEGEETEAYRYTQDDLYELQWTSTCELVPRLVDLNLCGSGVTAFDSFILKLLSVKDESERSELILKEAEARNFIKRDGADNFTFCSHRFPVDPPKIVTNRVNDTLLEIDRLKLIAKSDEELNEFTYRHEFNNLFDSVLKDLFVQSKTHEEIVQHLVDTNQAYIIEGEIRVNSKNHQEAYVSQPKRKKDVCVSKLILRKHAHHGDFVKVLVKLEAGDDIETPIDDDLDTSQSIEMNNRSFGCVLDILEKRHSRRVIGSLPGIKSLKKDRKHLMLNVRDPKIPNIRIGRDGIPKDVELSDKMLMVVEITSWSHEQPKGRIVEVIGEKGQLKCENAAILLEHNLNPQPYAQHIIDQLPTEPFAIPDSEFAYRQDLRKLCIFSIDPETARDLDDALSCVVLPNGNLEIGVHISDVSYFLKENSELDDIVKEKATTIYLVDTVYHMLPVPLCLLCSLLPGSDKMAYSVFWEMKEATAEIVSTRFTRSVLNSCAKLSYEHAQMVIESETQDWSELEGEFPEIHNGFTVGDVANVISKLQKLAVIMREKRKANGALKIDQPKIAFKFDKDDQRMEAPVDFFKYPLKDSNRLIEEFMLLANISVATFIYEKFPEISLLRQHSPPNEGGMKKLVQMLLKQGIQIDVTSSSTISASMERIIGSAKAKAGMNAVLNLMVSKTMSRARYFCSETAKDESDFWHYALSIPMYTHFTSPIRRYADVLVHR